MNSNLSCLLHLYIQEKYSKNCVNLSTNELKDAFFSLKTKKSPGTDKINFNVIKHCFGRLCCPFKYLFNSDEGHYSITCLCPISVVPWFSKIFERVMYSRLYKYLTEKKYCIHNILVSKRPLYRTCICWACRSDLRIFWKQQRYWWHFCQLVKDVWCSRHTILLKKVRIYGITSANLP